MQSTILWLDGIVLMMSQSSSQIRIRVATAADVAAIIAIVNAAFSIETFIDGTRTDEERMAELMRTGGFLVAEDGAEHQGEGSGRIVAAVYTELRGERGYFGMLAVNPARQGSGLGRRMIEAAEDYLRQHGCKHVDIIVLSPRADLPPFYHKLGYLEIRREAARTSRPLKEGVECHGIIMSKAL
ncbi:MAG TPA: GNAT family N-acetyltransferase [Terriglobales bacterium]|nr:GNAT family N-acetyltransferase [Terriglobales bacterium]